jgi:hypothetical protein
MSISDLLVYQALINVVADRAYLDLATHENQHTFGNIYAGPAKRWMLKAWHRQYGEFIRSIEQLHGAGNVWIASTDIVAFYDTIDHALLLETVRTYCPEDERFLQLFRQCIAKWSAHSSSAEMSRGIPQGSNASDFLANLFLHHIDRELIVAGHHYVRYVDDVRILGPDKPSVQRGLILFDLALKRAGLVAQVSKTSVHEVKDIASEINRLRLVLTNPTEFEQENILDFAVMPHSEQAETLSRTLKDNVNEFISNEDTFDQPNDSDDDSNEELAKNVEHEAKDQAGDLDQRNNEWMQAVLLDEFLKSYSQLDDAEQGRQAETTLVYCLNRLEPHEELREQCIDLLQRLPWRSEPVTRYLGKFKEDPVVAKGLQAFIENHNVYSWHRANCLWALFQIGNLKVASDICRSWLADPSFDWYARTVATRILSYIAGQHAFLLECLRREQKHPFFSAEETSILRQELAFGAFQRLRSEKKQQVLLELLCTDPSSIVRRLTVYLLQLPNCKVTWDALRMHHERLSELADIVEALGISTQVTKPCLIRQTLASMYDVTISEEVDFRKLYATHYEKAVEALRASIVAYHRSPNNYVSEFHKFSHLTLIAFIECTLPEEVGLFESQYRHLTNRSTVRNKLPRGIVTWERLGSLRNRTDHPVDRSTLTYAEKISIKEMEDVSKELRVSLQELVDVWGTTQESKDVDE